jgi:hypothetical protein
VTSKAFTVIPVVLLLQTLLFHRHSSPPLSLFYYFQHFYLDFVKQIGQLTQLVPSLKPQHQQQYR